MVEDELGEAELGGFNRKRDKGKKIIEAQPVNIDSEPTTPKDVVKIKEIAVKPKYWKKSFSTVLYQDQKIYNVEKQREKEQEEQEFHKKTISDYKKLIKNLRNEQVQFENGDLRYSQMIANKFCKSVKNF